MHKWIFGDLLNNNTKNTKNLQLIWLGGFCGFVGPILTLILIITSTILSPTFRWDTNTLSDLGVGDVSLLFNSSLIIGGILNLLFTLGLYNILSKEKLAKTGATLIMLSSISLSLIGIFTLSYKTMHTIVALAEFILPPIGIILIGFSTKEKTIKKLSITTGITALTAILVLPIILSALKLTVGFAVPELLEALIVSTWIVFMATKLLKNPTKSHQMDSTKDFS